MCRFFKGVNQIKWKDCELQNPNTSKQSAINLIMCLKLSNILGINSKNPSLNNVTNLHKGKPALAKIFIISMMIDVHHISIVDLEVFPADVVLTIIILILTVLALHIKFQLSQQKNLVYVFILFFIYQWYTSTRYAFMVIHIPDFFDFLLFYQLSNNLLYTTTAIYQPHTIFSDLYQLTTLLVWGG